MNNGIEEDNREKKKFLLITHWKITMQLLV
jgi:hypothetical protein